MRDQLHALWPEAPVAESSPTGRWLRFDRPAGWAVYLQRYAWDEPCRAHYLVVLSDRRGAATSETVQRRYVELAEAVAALRGLVEDDERGQPPRR
jgi:hypothetical protein